MTKPDAEPMSVDAMAAGQIPSASVRERADARLGAGIAVTGELQASLERGRKAMLALDLEGIERETGKQAGLIREFESLQRPGAGTRASEKQEEEEKEADDDEGEQEEEFLFSAATPGLREKFRRHADRILEATRLQAALLARAQSKLRVLANILAGPSVIYSPLPGQGSARDVFGWKRSGGM
jgi:hypothetical protein